MYYVLVFFFELFKEYLLLIKDNFPAIASTILIVIIFFTSYSIFLSSKEEHKVHPKKKETGQSKQENPISPSPITTRSMHKKNEKNRLENE